MRARILIACALLCMAQPAAADVNIRINLGGYPDFVQVPGYPVYYAPRLNQNAFFYDGMYWVYADDDWYASEWYDGPWDRIAPYAVPVYVLRVPVRYYRRPPVFFRGWRAEQAPRWGEHWGREWQQQRSGWDEWDRRKSPAPAPLPQYQRNYSGERYPRGDQQRALREQNYPYQPRESVVRERYQSAQRSQSRQPSQPAQNAARKDERKEERKDERGRKDSPKH